MGTTGRKVLCSWISHCSVYIRSKNWYEKHVVNHKFVWFAWLQYLRSVKLYIYVRLILFLCREGCFTVQFATRHVPQEETWRLMKTSTWEYIHTIANNVPKGTVLQIIYLVICTYIQALNRFNVPFVIWNFNTNMP